MHTQIKTNSDTEWPMTPDDIIREIRKPESPLRKLLNAAENEAAFEKAFIDILFFNYELKQQQREALLSIMFEEARTANTAKFPDIISTPIFVHTQQLQEKVQDEHPSTQREILQEQLHQMESRLEDLQKVREIVVREYDDARVLAIDAMVEQAKKTPILKLDKTVLDIRPILESEKHPEDIIKKVLSSHIQKIEYEKNHAPAPRATSHFPREEEKPFIPKDAMSMAQMNMRILLNTQIHMLRKVALPDREKWADAAVESEEKAGENMVHGWKDQGHNIETVTNKGEAIIAEKRLSVIQASAEIIYTEHCIHEAKDSLNMVPERKPSFGGG